MKNVLIIRLREENFQIKFPVMQYVYKIIDEEKISKKILQLIGNSFDYFDIDNQTEENCVGTMFSIIESLIKNQKNLKYQFRYQNCKVCSIEKFYPHIRVFLKKYEGRGRFLMFSPLSEPYTGYFSIEYKKQNKEEYVYI